MNYSLPLRGGTRLSFEPIFEWLAHLSGLDFCLCQTQDREGREREVPWRHPAVQCRRENGHGLIRLVDVIKLGRMNSELLPEFPSLRRHDADPYDENRSELSAVISAMTPEGTARRGPLTINL